MNESEDSVNGIPVSEFPSSSQDSEPMCLDADDTYTQRETPTSSYSFSSQPATKNSSSVINHQLRPQFLQNGLRSIEEIPEPYRRVFGDYPCFNRIQSMVMDVVFYSSEPLLVTAPTGSGKTVIFELAMIQLLMSFGSSTVQDDFKIVYMAPVKALCTEKLHDWARKFAKLNINCLEVTGDSDITDLDYLKRHQLILTTPEKWDSLTRRWVDHASLMKSVRLFMIDEVHILNDETRGPTLEAVVSRMKMLKHQQHSDNQSLPSLRFIAVSATIPNVEDLAQWLGSHERPAKLFKIDEEMRPVKLTKIVKGYEQKGGSYMFDIHLSYKLKSIISQYSEGKPTLVFCSTRKSVLATAEVLAKMITFNLTIDQRAELSQLSDHVVDKKVRESLLVGIGCHHAGLVMSDRNLLEKAFRDGLLPVLIATSTLAMGVNLPAHLVVVKSTQYYGNGGYQEYSDSQLLQMMGRAGRPQFDTTATAVIMTRAFCQDKYSRLTAGTEPIQSSLHRHLVEHINAEVVLGTITDLPAAVDWIRSTFLFVRANRHPQQYGLAVDPGNAVKINAKLQDMVQVELNALARHKLVETNGMDVRDTPAGRLMARYYIAFQTMTAFLEVQGDESLADLLAVVAKAAEFQDVQLRHDEKAALNALNSKKDGAPGLRFPIKGRIKDRDAKVNCLLQALLGGVHIVEPALQQEAGRVVRTAERLSKCLSEVVKLSGNYRALHAALLLHKCVRCQLWETSPLAARQLPRIGPVLAQLLAAAGKTSLALVASSNPRDLERIINRLPPFGNELRDAAAAVPKLTLSLERRLDTLELQVDIGNPDVASRDARHWVNVLVGDSENRVLVCDKFPCSKLLQGTYCNQIEVSAVASRSVTAHVISEMWIGIDAEQTVHLREPSPAPAARPKQPPKQRKTSSFMDKMKEVANRMDDTPSYRLQANQGNTGSLSQRFDHFRKTQAKKLQHTAEDDADDPDDPPECETATLSRKPSKAAPPKPPVVEVVTLDPWDEDSGDAQVVPDESWTPKQEPVDTIEYSSFPNQPTIRNFFKPKPPASPPASPPFCTTASIASADAAPASRFDLDDSWDLDILVAVDGHTFVPCVKSIPDPKPPEISAPYRTDKENWAGCWDRDLSIGIDDLLRSLDDEAAADNRKALLSSEGSPPDIDWCGGRGAPKGPAPLDAPPPGSLVEMKIGSENDDWLSESLDLSGLDIPEDLAPEGVSPSGQMHRSPRREELAGDGPEGGPRVEDSGETVEEWKRELEEWKKGELEVGNLHELASDQSWLDCFKNTPMDTDPQAEGDGFHQLGIGAGLDAGDASGKSCLEDVQVHSAEIQVKSDESSPQSRLEKDVQIHPSEIQVKSNESVPHSRIEEEVQVHPDEIQVKSDESAPHSRLEEDVQLYPAEIQVKSGEESASSEEMVPCMQTVDCCQEESGQDAGPKSPAERCQEGNGQDVGPRTLTPQEGPKKADVNEPLPVKPPTGQGVDKEVPYPQETDNTPRKEQADCLSPEGPVKGVKEEHRVAKAREILSLYEVAKRPRLFVSETEAEKSSSTSSNDREETQKVISDGPDAGNATPLPHQSQTFQAAFAAVRASVGNSTLPKILPQDPRSQTNERTKDDVLAKLLSDWSSRYQAKAVTKLGAPTTLPRASPLAAVAAGRQFPAAPIMHGVVHGGAARRTAAGMVTNAPGVDKQDDMMERILQEDYPRRLPCNGKEVRPFNTERLRAAGVARAESCVFSKQLGKQLAQVVPPAIGTRGEQAACRPGPSSEGRSPCNAATSDGHVQVVASVTRTVCDDAETARGGRPSLFAATPEKSVSGFPPRKKAAAAPAEQTPHAAVVTARHTATPPTSAVPTSQAPDWFDRLLKEPVSGLVRRPTGLLGLRGTAKRRADSDAGSAVQFKRPTVPSVWQQMALQPQAPPRPPQPSASSAIGMRGAISATATRTPPAAATLPPSRSRTRPDGLEVYGDEINFGRGFGGDVHFADFPRPRDGEHSVRRAAPTHDFDDVFGDSDTRSTLDPPPPRQKRHHTSGHNASGELDTLDSPPRRHHAARHDTSGELDTLDSPPRRHHAARHDASALHLLQIDDEEPLSPIRDFSGLLDDNTPPMAPKFQCCDRDDRKEEPSFESRHGYSSFEEGSFERESFDRDAADLWRECPTSAAPPGSPEYSISQYDDRFPRHQDSPDEDGGASSPMASFWARRGSPSYSPAPQSSFNWRPSLSLRSRDEDPFAYVPQSTLVAPRCEEEGGDARSPCCTPRSQRRPPSSPNVSGKMVLCLSPAERSAPPPNMSKWHGYLG